MTVKDVVKAWKNPAFRSMLSADESALLPGNPAGMIELSGTALDAVSGGGGKGSGKGSGGSGKGSGRGSGKGSGKGSGRSGKGSGKR